MPSRHQIEIINVHMENVAAFLHVAGLSAQQVFDTMTFTDADKRKIISLVQAYEQYCEPRKNRTGSRYHFNSRKQKVGEKFDTFLTNLRVFIKDCEHGVLQEKLLMDRIVCGRWKKVGEKLLHSDDLTLAIKLCQGIEMSHQYMTTMSGETDWQM